MKSFLVKISLLLGSFFNDVDGFVNDHVKPAVDTIKRLAGLINNPVADVLTALIPGDLDDVAKAWVRKNLNKALSVVIPVENILSEKDFAKRIEKVAEYIKKQPSSLQKGILLRLSAEMANSSGGKDKRIKGHSIDLLTQLQYSKQKETAEIENLPNVYCNNCGTPQ